MMSLPTGTITFLFTDIEGSTRLWEQYPEQMRQAHARHGELIAAAIEKQGGVFVRERGEGDSTFSVFTIASDAVAAACDFQLALAAESWPAATPIRVRAALHTGTAELRDEDYNSTDVNRCARLRAIAHGGQTLVSQTVYDLAHASLPPEISFKDLGRHGLKDLQEPERVWQLCHADLLEEFPPLKSAQPLHSHLPLALTPFIGRDAQIQEWYQLLRQPEIRLLSLCGFGGIGKSRAALRLAEMSVDDFEDGVWWVDLQAAYSCEAMRQQIASSLHLNLTPHGSVREQLSTFLQERRLLLILDNTEQIADAGEVVHELLQSAPGLKCLVTTRRALGLRAEQVVEVTPLSAPDAERLFSERARAHSADFTLTPANAQDVAELCRRLECVPLLLELAAAHIIGMTPREMLRRLNERFRLLQTRSPDLPPRQRAIRGTIDWSYELLNSEEKSLFAQLAVFTGGFTLEDAEAVCAAPDVFESVMGLRRHSLLCAATDEPTQQVRYSMLESLRDYAIEKLQALEDQGESVRRRHALYFLRFARDCVGKLRTSEEADALRRLAADSDNIRSAMEWARQNAEPDLYACLALMSGRLLQRRGFYTDAAEPVRAALDRAQPVRNADPGLYAELLEEYAGLLFDQSDFEAARERAQEAMQLYRDLEQPQSEARVQNLLGEIAATDGDLAD